MSAPKNDRSGIKKVLRALTEAGYKIKQVQYADGETVDVTTVKEAVEEVMGVDDAFVILDTGAWVRFVLGNDPSEVASDWTMSLDQIIDPLTRSWW